MPYSDFSSRSFHAALDHWLTTPPEEYDNEDIEFAHIQVSDRTVLVEHILERSTSEDEDDFEGRVRQWVIQWCDKHEYDIDYVDVDIEFE